MEPICVWIGFDQHIDEFGFVSKVAQENTKILHDLIIDFDGLGLLVMIVDDRGLFSPSTGLEELIGALEDTFDFGFLGFQDNGVGRHGRVLVHSPALVEIAADVLEFGF